MLLGILIYWGICGLILFSLTQPTVTVFNVPGETIVEFFACILLGGLLIPIITLAFILYWIPVILFNKGDE